MPYQGRFIGIFFPHFYLKEGGNMDTVWRRLGVEPEFSKKARSRFVKAFDSHTT